MIGNTIPFDLPGFQIETITEHDNKLLIQADSTEVGGECPDCGVWSSSIHSYYTRSPRDLPSSGHMIRLMLTVHRFRCQNQRCPRRTFAEQLPEVVPWNGQRTYRLTKTLRSLAFAVGGKPGARVLRHFSIHTSGDTLIRIIRQTPLPVTISPTVIGVDDWAYRKGRRYGTLIVDLETHRPLDMLPSSEADPLVNWLQQHPSIRIISRDRSGTYVDAARRGAPQAIQIADRWHLLKNLYDALVIEYEGHSQWLHQIKCPFRARAAIMPIQTDLSEPDPPDPPSARPLNPKQQMQRDRRLHWEAMFTQVHQLLQEGMSSNAIARELHISRGTVKKYSLLPILPRKVSPKPGPRLLDPYRAYLRERLSCEVVSSRQLWQEIRTQGFTGGHSTVYTYWRQLQHESSLANPEPSKKPAFKTTPLSARTLAALVLSPDPLLSDFQRFCIQLASELHPHIEKATQLAQTFIALLRQREIFQLASWFQRALASSLPTLVRFAQGIYLDPAAQAAFIYPWSNAQVEGQINRLKYLKRQMYGRAKFDLLRLRVLYSDP